jgi:hypothetical protein
MGCVLMAVQDCGEGKAAYLITALYELVFCILHGIPTRANYEELLQHLGSIQ